VVDVVDEQVQRVDALLEATLDRPPLGRPDDARDQVEGKDAFNAGVIAINCKRDSLVHEKLVGNLFLLLKGTNIKVVENRKYFIVLLANGLSVMHLVPIGT